MSDLRLELSPDDPFLASLSAVRAADDAAVTSAGYTSIAEYQTDLAWYRSINDTRDDASFGSKTMDQLQSQVSSNPHIYNWPGSGSMFHVTLSDN